MEIPLLKDIGIIFGLSIIVILIFNKIKVPAIIGFLLTGAIASPYGLGLVHNTHNVETLAEIGIVLLLFTIGIEFSLESLLQIRKSVLVGGSVQVLLSGLCGFAIAYFLKFPFGQSVFMGFLISLSSTAIVMKLIQDSDDVDTPHGKTILGILIFQDIIAIPMMLVAPLLSGKSPDADEPAYILLFRIIIFIAVVFACYKYLVPRLLYQIVKTRINELFLLTICGICIGIALLTSSMGLSLALGAFIAGLIISESEYSHQALSHILPFKDIFTSFFFVSVGMLLNTVFFINNFLIIILLTSMVLIFKFLAGCIATGTLGYSLRTAVLAGVGICQVGEFSFVISKVGITYNLLNDNVYQIFLAVSVLTMAITPFAYKLSPGLADFVLKLPLPDRLKAGLLQEDYKKGETIEDHIVIIGFGLNGHNLARVAFEAGIPYVILEMNPKTVKKEKEKGQPIFYGDATQELVLEHLNLRSARVVVLAISDAAATRKVIELIRRMDKSIHLIVRTRYLPEIYALYELGANEVITEEFETSIEIFTRVLGKYLVPKDEIESFIDKIRSEQYEMMRSVQKRVGTASLHDVNFHLSDVEIVTFTLKPGSKIVGKSLIELDLRKNYGVTVLAVRRGIEMIASPDSNLTLQAKDIVILVGKIEKINQVENIF